MGPDEINYCRQSYLLVDLVFENILPIDFAWNDLI